jgi:putative acetyltransferase
VLDIETRRESLTSDVAMMLIAALNAELLQRYPEEGATHFRLDADEVAAGRGAFLVAYAAAEAVGCGALRRRATNVAEVKRLYVVPPCRGHGIGGVVLRALEREARLLGVSRLVLETGERQPEAVALYRRAGFAVVPAFDEYIESPLSLCMAKDLP